MESPVYNNHDININYLRNKISEVFDETKRNIENQSLLLIKIINQIKRENNLFYHNCLNILANEEQRTINNSFIHTDTTNKKDISKLQISNHISTTAKVKISSPVLKHDSSSLPKKKISNKQPKHLLTTPNHSTPIQKSTTSSSEYIKPNIANKTRKHQFAFNINKMIQYGKKKQDYSYKTQLTITTNKNSSQFLHSSCSHNSSSIMISNRNGCNNNIKRNENRKMTSNEVRKFSIIDIPCADINEVNKAINNHSFNISSKSSLNNSINNNNGQEREEDEGDDKQITIKSESRKHSYKNIEMCYQTFSSQFCYIMAKEA